jgi:hypothetical protein
MWVGEQTPAKETTNMSHPPVLAAGEPSFDQPFIGMTATYGDFLRYVVPDLRTNTTRGLLAEMMNWERQSRTSGSPLTAIGALIGGAKPGSCTTPVSRLSGFYVVGRSVRPAGAERVSSKG